MRTLARLVNHERRMLISSIGERLFLAPEQQSQSGARLGRLICGDICE